MHRAPPRSLSIPIEENTRRNTHKRRRTFWLVNERKGTRKSGGSREAAKTKRKKKEKKIEKGERTGKENYPMWLKNVTLMFRKGEVPKSLKLMLRNFIVDVLTRTCRTGLIAFSSKTGHQSVLQRIFEHSLNLVRANNIIVIRIKTIGIRKGSSV